MQNDNYINPNTIKLKFDTFVLIAGLKRENLFKLIFK